MADLTSALVQDARVLMCGVPLRDHALSQLSLLALSDQDWLRLLALARAMTLIPSPESGAGRGGAIG